MTGPINGTAIRWLASVLVTLVLAVFAGLAGHTYAKLERHEAAITANATQIAILQNHLTYLRVSSDRQEANQEKLRQQLDELLRRIQ